MLMKFEVDTSKLTIQEAVKFTHSIELAVETLAEAEGYYINKRASEGTEAIISYVVENL